MRFKGYVSWILFNLHSDTDRPNTTNLYLFVGLSGSVKCHDWSRMYLTNVDCVCFPVATDSKWIHVLLTDFTHENDTVLHVNTQCDFLLQRVCQTLSNCTYMKHTRHRCYRFLVICLSGLVTRNRVQSSFQTKTLLHIVCGSICHVMLYLLFVISVHISWALNNKAVKCLFSFDQLSMTSARCNQLWCWPFAWWGPVRTWLGF